MFTLRSGLHGCDLSYDNVECFFAILFKQNLFRQRKGIEKL